MEKEFDCVKLMREIREKLSELYKNPDIEKEELLRIRKKYGIAGS